MTVLVACEESQTVCKAFRDRGIEAYSCAECPHCKQHGIRKEGFMGAGYKYGICRQGGNVVFLEPWKEKKIYGSGYISHKVSSCGRHYSPKEENEMEV